MQNRARWKLLGNIVLLLAIALGTVGVVRLVAYAYQLCGCGCESFVCPGGSMYTPVGEGTPTPTPKCKQVDCRCLPNFTNTPGSSPTPTDTPISGGSVPPTATPRNRKCGFCPKYCNAIETPECFGACKACQCGLNGCSEDVCPVTCYKEPDPCEDIEADCPSTKGCARCEQLGECAEYCDLYQYNFDPENPNDPNDTCHPFWTTCCQGCDRSLHAATGCPGLHPDGCDSDGHCSDTGACDCGYVPNCSCTLNGPTECEGKVNCDWCTHNNQGCSDAGGCENIDL